MTFLSIVISSVNISNSDLIGWPNLESALSIISIEYEGLGYSTGIFGGNELVIQSWFQACVQPMRDAVTK